eukprot:CAMPEP_0182438368 /NCGR_PEP_ID=MMETSP1167-20130531/85716_1 /TAXON_ID=2988 /ORGANISM="Mallomonas Sp, Strain CCMP3275" /LENGTH=41 /DNA_ID= /DNA_START= /DNA_END= /DNA_ORIENTATION=
MTDGEPQSDQQQKASGETYPGGLEQALSAIQDNDEAAENFW